MTATEICSGIDQTTIVAVVLKAGGADLNGLNYAFFHNTSLLNEPLLQPQSNLMGVTSLQVLQNTFVIHWNGKLHKSVLRMEVHDLLTTLVKTSLISAQETAELLDFRLDKKVFHMSCCHHILE